MCACLCGSDYQENAPSGHGITCGAGGCSARNGPGSSFGFGAFLLSHPRGGGRGCRLADNAQQRKQENMGWACTPGFFCFGCYRCVWQGWRLPCIGGRCASLQGCRLPWVCVGRGARAVGLFYIVLVIADGFGLCAGISGAVL